MTTKPSWKETVQLIAAHEGLADGLARQHAADDGLGHCPVCRTAAPCVLAILAADALELQQATKATTGRTR